MCGRFTRYPTWREIHAAMDLIPSHPALNVAARSDIRPTTDILIVRRGEEGNTAANVRWGLIPSVWPDPAAMKRYVNHNARKDKLMAPRGWWKKPLETRRCLIVGSGYYEWKENPANPKAKKPRYYFEPADGSPIAFAGMWDFNAAAGVESCTMITTEPNAYVAEIHDRMPAILPRRHWFAWLDPKAKSEDLLELLQPAPADLLVAKACRSDIKDGDARDALFT